MRLVFAASLLLPACAPPAEPDVAELAGAEALVQLDDDPTLYRQLAEGTLAPVLPEGARVLGFRATDSHAWVQLSEPLWVVADGGGQWCTLLDLPLDQGDEPALGCVARAVESDPDAPPADIPVEIDAYDDDTLWVLWRVQRGGAEGYEVWAHRDGAGVEVAAPFTGSLGFAVEGGLVLEGTLWSLDPDGTPVSTSAPGDVSPARWGPYQLTDEPYGLFRRSEGRFDLEDRMTGDPACATGLSESDPTMVSDGPTLLVRIGTIWDDDYDVPPGYCRCDLDFDCRFVPDAEEAALDAVRLRDFVSPRTPDGTAYGRTRGSLHFLRDGALSRDLGAEHAPEHFWYWGRDLYFTEPVAELPDRLYHVDWSDGDVVVTELPGYDEDVLRMVRL